MIFTYLEYLPQALIGFLVIALLILLYEMMFFRWIKKYWFFGRTLSSKLSTFFYLLAVLLFIISLLDLRGPEEIMETAIPDQYTLILIDNSMSMSVEDVYPNRYLKATTLARHFVKNALGHQISLFLFADTLKQVSPFTDDYDFLDAKISAMSEIGVSKGGTDIRDAIMSAEKYLIGELKTIDAIGNILVISDVEDNSNKKEFKISPNINLAFVGVGSAHGGKIPIKDADGRIVNYKKFKGEEVLSKLDSATIESLGKNLKYFKYWLAFNQEIPTQEIVEFFKLRFYKALSKENVSTRPVYATYIVIVAIFLYSLSVIFGLFKTFRANNSRRKLNSFSVAKKNGVLTGVLFFIWFTFLVYSVVGVIGVADVQAFELPFLEKNQLKANEELKSQFLKLKNGKLTKIEKQDLALMFARNKNYEKAISLYQETVPIISQSENISVLINYATVLLAAKRKEEGLSLFHRILKERELSKSDQKFVEKQVLFAFNSDTNSNDKKNDKSKVGDDKKENDKTQNNKKNQEDKSSKQNEQENNKQNGGQNLQNKMKEKELDLLKKKRIQVPSLYKQLVDDDKKLQQRVLDTELKKGSRLENNMNIIMKDKRDW